MKYLHEKAAEYDVGIYFEANGHGTVLYSEQLLCWLEARKNELASASAGEHMLLRFYQNKSVYFI